MHLHDDPRATPDYVPMALWGLDHWSTYAYIASRITNHGGTLASAHMRCNMRLHSRMAYTTPLFGHSVTCNQPTILRDGSEFFNHDDWSCVEDFLAAGLIEGTVIDRPGRVRQSFACYDFTATFTPPGWSLWHELNEWMAQHPDDWQSTFIPAPERTPHP
jgi:hypothetical protein